MPYGAYEYLPDETHIWSTLIPQGVETLATMNPFKPEGQELIGVAAVGAAITYGVSRALDKELDSKTILCGAALYTLGYFVASKRPESGWL